MTSDFELNTYARQSSHNGRECAIRVTERLSALACPLLLSVTILGLLPGCAALQADTKPKLHVISLANQTRGREVEVSIADPAADHVIVLLSYWPVWWKLSIAKGTRVQGVLFSSGNTDRDNSVVTGLPEGLVAVDVRLPKPIRRYGYGEKFGTIQLREDFIELREKLLARYGVEIATFQSGVSQTSFMIR